MSIDGAFDPRLLEVATGSPFGAQLLGGRMPMFDPYGWDPDLGLAQAIDAIGWACDVTTGGTAETAEARLRAASPRDPILVGPVDMGLLRYQPGMSGPIGADHFVVVLGVDADRVVSHDPHGHPYATLPIHDFLAAWSSGTVGYGEPFTGRTAFRRVRDVSPDQALRTLLPAFTEWSAGRTDLPVPPGTLGNRDAVLALADAADDGLDPEVKGTLTYFSARVGARRAADGAWALRELGLPEAADVLTQRARLLGGLQYDLVHDIPISPALRRLAETYPPLTELLRAAPVGR
ncbi:hypothetical protein [Stackebrandtia soli]|uniref:hypothetical protein n=1 Tax=Stackebrandtia soli TaxID=1892856 RepID=UPI0039EB114E